MEKVVQSTYGEITFIESFWTGKKQVLLNDQKLKKVDKNIFVFTDEEGKDIHVLLNGNYINGTTITIGSETIQATAKAKWYEYALAVMIFMIVLIWGNSKELCSIIPIVGGAIGGAINGVMSFSTLIIMKPIKNVLVKILIALGMLVATIAICFVVLLALIPLLV